jgi:hypothetical protein
MFVISFLNIRGGKKTSILFFFLIGFYSFLIAFSSVYYDTSSDGQEYHQETIFALSDEKWNPLKEASPPANTFPKLDTWVKHYPKGSEILSASVYSITDKIESGKVFNLLFIFSSFSLVFFSLINTYKVKIFYSFLIGFITALNPVSIYQSLSYYLDGEISSLIIIGITLIVLYLKTREKIILISFLGILCLLITFKFTAVLYAIILSVTLLIFLFLKEKNIKKFLNVSILLFLAGIFGVIALGFNPYVYNTVNHGHPFHPLAGKDSVDFMPANTPDEYKPLNKIEKILASSFILKTNNNKILLRIPFHLEEWNFELLKYTDLRVEGFGPFFMEISLITSISGLFLVTNKGIDKRKKLLYLLSCFLIIVSVLLIPESWWARYVPQMYLIPIITVTIFFININKIKFHTQLLLLFLILNSLYVTSIYLDGAKNHKNAINSIIENLKNEEREIVIYKYGHFHNNIRRFEENNIEYILIDDIEEWNQIQIEGPLFPNSDFQVRYR